MPCKSLPWRNPKPLCKLTIKMVNDATRGWQRTTHWLHHAEFRRIVYTVVIVAARLELKAYSEPPGDALGETQTAVAEAAGETRRLPVLPIELWMCVMGFFLRSWWAVDISSAGVC